MSIENHRRSVLCVFAVIAIALSCLALPASASYGTFWDDDGSVHEADIEAIAAEGITKGCGAGKFCPDNPVTRQEMAAFLYRSLKSRVDEGKATSFTDTANSQFQHEITWMSATGITSGCGASRFCPSDHVTREQMAAFLRRALEGQLSVRKPMQFSDISSSIFRDDILWLSAAGVTKGCGSGRFCPNSVVTRQQMASFLTRALGLDPIAPKSVVTQGIFIPAGAPIQTYVGDNPAGSTFVLGRGSHRGQRVVPKDGNVFVGEPGAVLDGGGSVDHAFVGDADNVTIEGLVVKNYANPAQSGAINGWGSGWKILDNEVRDNAGAGVLVRDGFVLKGNKIHHNDQIGILGRGANGQVINNEIAHNNYRDRYEMGWEAGGTKFMYTTNLRVAGNNVHDNHGIGLWTDHNNYKTLYENNTVRDNYGPGIMHEISYDATIRNNTVTGNAHKFYVGGILIATSSNVTAYGNVLSGNDGGINGIQDNRGSGDRGTFATTGLQVQDNNVSFTVGWNGVRVNSGTNVTQSGTILYEDNDYDLGSDNTPFLWNNSEITIQQWKTLGFDTNGTFK